MQISAQLALRTIALVPQLARQSTVRMMASGGFYGPRQQQIEQKLAAAFDPVHMEVINTSHGGVEQESHFKVVLVSDIFEGKRLIARHQSVNKALMEEDGNLGFRASPCRTAPRVCVPHISHTRLPLETLADSLEIGAAKTPSEWGANNAVPESPRCMGGDGSGMTR